MIEASHATITDAVLRDALKTIAVRQIPSQRQNLGVLAEQIGDLAGSRVVRTPRRTLTPRTPTQARTTWSTDVAAAVGDWGVAAGEAPEPEDRDADARRLFSAAPGIRQIRITCVSSLRIFGQMPGYEISSPS